VLTATAFTAEGGAAEVRLTTSRVRFRPLGAAGIREYLSRVNPLDKAGAYDIDQCGELLIEDYEGSYTNIMGLPRELVEEVWARWNR
jgi:septum formation protein